MLCTSETCVNQVCHEDFCNALSVGVGVDRALTLHPGLTMIGMLQLNLLKTLSK